MAALFANNASTTLAGTVLIGATTATLATGTGALFPSPTGSNYFLMTFSDAATGAIREIVKVTNRTGDVVTIVRAQEGTAAAAWSSGDHAANLWTAGSAGTFAQSSAVQTAASNYAADTGTANAVVVTLAPVPAAYVAGLFVYVKKIASQNTGAMTINVNGLGVKNLVAPGGGALVQGQLPSGAVFSAVYDGTAFQIQSGYQTPRTGELFDYPAATPPSYALARDGSAISRTGYPGLNAMAAAAGYADPWGAGDGSTTFNLPNDGGLFVRGWISGQVIDPGRGFGSIENDAEAAHTHTTNLADGAGHMSNLSGSGTGLVATGLTGQITASVSRISGANSGAGTETRPINRAYLPCICI